jgi:hypothetical protein
MADSECPPQSESFRPGPDQRYSDGQEHGCLDAYSDGIQLMLDTTQFDWMRATALKARPGGP